MIFFHSILFKFVTFFISCSLISTITDLFTFFKTLVTSYPACRTNSTAINKLVPSLYLSTLLQQCCCVGPTFYVMGLRFLMQIYCRLALTVLIYFSYHISVSFVDIYLLVVLNMLCWIKEKLSQLFTVCVYFQCFLHVYLMFLCESLRSDTYGYQMLLVS